MPLAEPLVASDIVIIVMGQTGSAKSTFINSLFGAKFGPVPVGNSLIPCTERVTGKFLTNAEHLGADRLFVMDTPGLDYESDAKNVEIINGIIAMLDTDDAGQNRRAGIIYLHNIDSIRPHKPDDKQRELFRRVTSYNGWPSLVFGITIWNQCLYEEEGSRKEEEFGEKIWKEMLQKGAQIIRVLNQQPESAWDVVAKILKAVKQQERKRNMAHIMLLGQTGSGKSTFINIAGAETLERKPRIGHGLEPCTKLIEEFELEDPYDSENCVRLIDTPGLNSDVAGDQMQLKMVSEWLKKKPKATLNGILFLDEELSQRRATHLVMTPSDIPRNPPGVWIITTKENTRDAGSYHADACVKHFDNTRESAWEIIRDVRRSGKEGHISFCELAKALDPKSTGLSFMDRILELLGIKRQQK